MSVRFATAVGNGRWRKIVLTGLRVLLGVLFVYAGGLKLGAPQRFADSIASFRLLPWMLVDPLALGLPPFEIGLGLWLASGWQRRPAAFCALSTSTIFLLALGSALIRGIVVDCGCFGRGGVPLIGSGHTVVAVVRDLGLAIVSALLYISAARADQKQ